MNGLLTTCYDRLTAIYRAHLGSECGRTVLDIGCGDRGNFLAVGKDDYTGVDCDEKIIAALGRRADGRYLVMDARKLDLPPKSFNYIVSTSFFHHLSDPDCRKVCVRMGGLLKKDGRIIIADGVYPQSRGNIAGWIIRACDRGRYVRTDQRMKAIFAENFRVEKEYYFVDKIFAYYVLVLSQRKTD